MEKSSAEKDEILMQFLGMTEDRVDAEVASAILESTGWNLQAAVDQIFGGSPTNRAATAMADPPAMNLGGSPMDVQDPLANFGGAGNNAANNARPQTADDPELQRALAESAEMAMGSYSVAASNARGNADHATQATSLCAGNPSSTSSSRPSGSSGPQQARTSSTGSSSAAGGARSAEPPSPSTASGLLSGILSGIAAPFSPTNASAGNAGAQAPGFFDSLFGGGSSAQPDYGQQRASTSSRAQPAGVDLSQEEADAQMARALEESYKANTGAGRQQTEEEQMRQAMAMSKTHDERMQRDQLKAQQDAELAESALMDQVRETEERERREAEELVRRQQAEEEARAAALAEDKRTRVETAVRNLPAEPEDADANRLALAFRLPNGKSVKRKFSKNHTIKHLYDFVDGHLLEIGEEDAIGNYHLASTFPKFVVEKTDLLISTSKIENQMALIIQKL